LKCNFSAIKIQKRQKTKPSEREKCDKIGKNIYKTHRLEVGRKEAHREKEEPPI
jgi:hypothetical protein